MRTIVIVGTAAAFVVIGAAAAIRVGRTIRDAAPRPVRTMAQGDGVHDRPGDRASARPPKPAARAIDETTELPPANAPEGGVPAAAPPKPNAVAPATPVRSSDAMPRAARPQPAQPPPADAQPNESLVPEPVARQALSFVGADPLAEAAWAAAINDPSIAAEQRKDLIEDLNQDGFEDPRHLTPDDLPLIVSRLALIEELAPDSMDEVNAAAFAEAYKDLVNMLLKVSAQ